MREAVDMHETAAAPLASFPAIFSQAMSLGLLSKRRVYHEATQLLQRQSGSLKVFTGAHLQRPEAECPAALTFLPGIDNLAYDDADRLSIRLLLHLLPGIR